MGNGGNSMKTKEWSSWAGVVQNPSRVLEELKYQVGDMLMVQRPGDPVAWLATVQADSKGRLYVAGKRKAIKHYPEMCDFLL